MSVQNRLEALSAALVAVSVDCYHYFAPAEAKAPYIVWYEESEDTSFDTDNHKTRQALSGYVDYFTRTEFDPTFDAIQEALNSFEGLSWTWESTLYGDPTQGDTNLIHHTWSWRLM